MECTIENAGPYVRVYLKGRLFSKDAAAIFDDLIGLATVAGGKVLLNLEGVTAASPAGSRIIVVAARLLYVRGGRLVICGARPDVLMRLRERSANYAFHSFPTEDLAEEALQNPDRVKLSQLRSVA